MAILTLCAGMMVYYVMQTQSEDFLRKGLQIALQVRVEHLVHTIKSGIDKSAAIATRPYLIDEMRLFDNDKSNVEARTAFIRAAKAGLPDGFAAIAFYDRDGNEVAGLGEFSLHPEMSVALSGEAVASNKSPTRSRLLRDKVMILRVDADIMNGGALVGTVSTEEQLPGIDGMFLEARALGESAEMALCAPLDQDMQCFPTTLTPRVFPRLSRLRSGKPLPMSYALAGDTGVITARDYRDQEVVAAYSPVADLGMGMVMKIDNDELYQPIHRRLEFILFLLLLLVLGGRILLRWQLTPLVKRLVRSECEARENYNHLLASDAHIRVLTEVSPVGIFRTDENGDCIYVNDRYCEITGLSLQQALGQGWVHALYPEDSQRVIAAWNESVRDKLPFNIECRYRQANGDVVWILAQATRELNDSGKVKGYIGSITDITERRHAEEALKNSETRYRNIVELAQEGIWQIDADGRTTFVNRKMAEILGYTVTEMQGQSIFSFMDDEGRRITAQNIGRRRRGITEEHEFEFIRKDGVEVRTLLSTSPLFDDQGRYTGAFAMVSDITERKRWETALIQSEKNFRILIEDANVGILVHYQGKHEFANTKLLNMLGYTLEEFRTTTMRDIVHPDEFEKVAGRYRARTEGQDVPSLYDTILRTKGGVSLAVELTSTKTIWEGKSAGLVLLQDITDRQQAVDQMRKLSSAVEQTADSVIITDTQGVIEYVNQAFERITGYRRDEAVGQTPRLIKSDRQRPEFYDNLWRMIRAGEIYNDVFINRRKDGSLYHEEKTITPLKDAAGRITHFVSTGKDVTERVQIQERLQYMAQHDALTDLPNRVLLFDRLKRALVRARRHQCFLAVMFIDLDRFKNINDSLGHEAGDQLLQQLSDRLRRCVRGDDTVARFGGDEFVILLEDVARDDDVRDVAQKVLEKLLPPFKVGAQQLFITASIGVSLYPNDGEDSSTLLKYADVAMYRAKELGKNTYQFYSAEMSARAFERLTLESNLRHALDRGEFHLYYQPQFDTMSGMLVGVEALLRWRHPKFGMVMPAEFMPMLEETGLIVPVGEWVLKAACAQLRAWHDAGWPSMRMAVNLSARQFGSKSLVASVEDALALMGGNPAQLELEITESIFMRHAMATADALSELFAMGCRFAIDDFGTGYSSLAYLKRFPINALKIDHSFVRDIPDDQDDGEIVSTIIAMAHNLQIEVVAEGVETEAQVAFLRACGCDCVQGYLFSRPLPAEEVVRHF